MEDDIVALVARFELASAESKSAVLTAGPNEYLVSVAAGSGGVESNSRPFAYKATALPLSYAGSCQRVPVVIGVVKAFLMASFIDQLSPSVNWWCARSDSNRQNNCF